MEWERKQPHDARRLRLGKSVSAALVAWSMVVGTVAVLPAAAGAQEAPEASEKEKPDWVEDLADRAANPGDPPEAPAWVDSEDLSAPSMPAGEAVPPGEFEFPKAGSWEVSLGVKDQRAKVAKGEAGPVEIAAGVGNVDGERLEVEVLGRSVAERLGVSGFVFEVSEAASSSGGGVLSQEAEGKGPGLPTDLAVDYSEFEHAYGADYVGRLQVVALPDCVLEDPVPEGCDRGGRRLQTRVDREAEELVVEVEELAELAVDGAETDTAEAPSETGTALEATGPAAEELATVGGSGGVVFALMSSHSGETGSWGATPMSQTGTWQVSSGSGEFSWSYPFDLPASPAGDTPELGMSYSSAAVDGLTNSTNTQASQNGLGWSEFGNAFIERRYEPCLAADVLPTPDLCWESFNATISLEGVSGPMLPLDQNHADWAVQTDEGWKVERLTGASNGENDGEHWKVTATDGTQYFFGLGETPTGADTSSAWVVPVWADHSGEPCRGPNDTDQACDQAWRWNLDRIVDPDGNITSFQYTKEETAYYCSLSCGSFDGQPPKIEPYDRGGALNTIAWGWQEGDSVPAARVVFQRRHRCHTLDADNEDADDEINWCSYPPTSSNGIRFPDVPNDLICTASSCTMTSPAFFSTKRYRRATTEVRVGSEWRPVARYDLGHSFRTNSDDVQKLSLHGIQRVGLWLGGEVKHTSANFLYQEFPNRVDVDPEFGKPPMGHHRLVTIANEYGGLLGVEYGQKRPCPVDHSPSLWHDNTRDCFPQSSIDDGALRTGVFHKYLTTQVTEVPGDGSPNITTAYEYGDPDDPYPAWAFNGRSFAQGSQRWGWQDWRGYGTTTITQGASKTKVRAFRGMHGDALWADCGGYSGPDCADREVQVAPFSGPGQPFDGADPVFDLPALAGRTLEEQQIGTVDGVTNSVVQSTMYKYAHDVTHEGTGFNAEWADVSETTESVATSPGQFLRRGGETTYTDNTVDGLPPRVATSVEKGWLDETGDERCSITTYAENEARWMLDYPATNVVRAGEDCATGEELAVSETYYDNSTTLGEVGPRGNPTLERTMLASSTWAETHTVFDSRGRPVEVTDPDGAKTTTSHQANPANAIPTQTTVTNDLGHSAVTELIPELQAPRFEYDANGNRTSYGYDSFGRVVNVWLPTEQPSPSAERSFEFTYLIDPDKAAPPVVRSRRLAAVDGSGEGVHWDESWTVYDRSLRERQTHTLSPDSGKVVVSETTYDNRGMARDQTVAQAVTGTPGDGLLSVSSWDNRTRSLYDELGRVMSEEWWRGSGPVRETSYDYGVDTVTVTGPDGAKVRETVDGLGRTVETGEHDGSDWVTSTSEYDLSDNLVAATDPEGNTTEYTYNLAGWRLTQDDPNRGTAGFGYDVAGNQTSITDAKNNQVHTIYDPLGRPVERRADSPTGDLLASWEYDAPEELGLLDREITHTADGDWVTDVDGYDERNRSLGTTLTVPAGIPGLSGSYTIQQGYDRADRVTDIGLPAVADLPEEWLTIKHNSQGLAFELDGLEQYVWAGHDDRGRLEMMSLGHPDEGNPWMSRGWAYDADQRVSKVETWVAGSAPPDGVVSSRELGYDEAGNLAEKLVSQNGSTQRECYDYDDRHRLTGAFTVASGEDCATGTPGGGFEPYDHSYSYSPDGNLLERVENSSTSTYSYPASGQDRPHAPTSVNGDSYTWDVNGNLVERTVGGDTETFAWDVEQQLTSVDGPNGETNFVYGAGGERLLRRTDNGATLYIAGHEITANSDGSEVKAVRSYSFGGSLIATRTAAGVDYMVTDDDGSVEMAIPSEGVPATIRNYDPYGKVRSEDGDPLATDQGFVGQIEDSATDLSYLNARYYDTAIGVFISTDPVTQSGDVKSLNPYTYAAGNPASLSDPGGTSPSYIWGLERSNNILTQQNKHLRAHIKRLGSHIKQLQGIIKKQNRQMNRMLTHIRALESVIRQQNSIINKLNARVRYLTNVVNKQAVIIGQLQARVRYLEGQVAYWRSQAYYWKGQAIYWRGQAMYWKGQAMYWKGRAMYWKGEAYKWRTTAWYYGTERNTLRAEVGDLNGRINANAGRGLGPVSAEPQYIDRWYSPSQTVGELRGKVRQLNAHIDSLLLAPTRLDPRVDYSGVQFGPSLWDKYVAPHLTLENALGCGIGVSSWAQAGAYGGTYVAPGPGTVVGGVGFGAAGCFAGVLGGA